MTLWKYQIVLYPEIFLAVFIVVIVVNLTQFLVRKGLSTHIEMSILCS